MTNQSTKTLKNLKAQLFEHNLPKELVESIIETEQVLSQYSFDLLKKAEGLQALSNILDAAGEERMNANNVHTLLLPIVDSLLQAVHKLNDTIS